MATMEKREQTPGKVTYRVRWWADGKQRSKSFKDYQEARRFKAVLGGDMASGSFIDPKHGQITLRAFMEQHDDLLLVDVRRSTEARVRSIYTKHLLPEFGHLPLNAITRAEVARWMTRQTATHSPSTLRKHVFALKGVLDLAVTYGFVKINPVHGLKLPPEARHEQRFLTQEQVSILAETIQPRFKALILLAVYGGLRAGELGGLQRKHVNSLASQVSVTRTLVDADNVVSFNDPKTKSSIRTVTVPRSVMNELMEHMHKYTGASPEALVFTGARGGPVRRMWFQQKYWAPTIAKVGFTGLRVHDLRHTFVALWVSLGRNALEVSKAAGHSSVSFTLDRYGHLYEQDDDGLADALDAMLGRSQEATGGMGAWGKTAGQRGA